MHNYTAQWIYIMHYMDKLLNGRLLTLFKKQFLIALTHLNPFINALDCKTVVYIAMYNAPSAV